MWLEYDKRNKDKEGVQRKRAALDHAGFYWCAFKVHSRVIDWYNGQVG